MKTYLITYNDIGNNGNTLGQNLKTIVGKTAQVALKSQFPDVVLKRVYGDGAKYSNVIVQEVLIKNGEPYILPRKRQLCFALAE